MSPETSPHIYQEPPPEKPIQVGCPLCRTMFEAGPFKAGMLKEGDQQSVVCPGCGLTFEMPEPEPEPVSSGSGEGLETSEQPASDVLDRWLAGEPVRSVPLSKLQLARRWMRKHPITVVAISTVLVLMVATALFPTATIVRLSNNLSLQRVKHNRRMQETESEKQKLQRQLLMADRRRIEIEQQSKQAAKDTAVAWAKRLSDLSVQLRDDDPDRSLLLATQSLHVMLNENEPLLIEARQIVRDALQDTGSRRLVGHADRITSLAVSSDSCVLASGSYDRTVRLWHLADTDPSSSVIVLKGHRGCVSDVTFSPDSRWLTTGSFDTTARLWDITAADPAAASMVLRGHLGRIGTVGISSDSRWLVTGSGGFRPEENTARIWDLSATHPPNMSVELRGHAGPIQVVAVSPNNRWVVTASEDGTARLWDLTASQLGNTSLVLHSHGGPITAVSFSADNRYLATGSESGLSGKPALTLWDMTSQAPFTSTVLHDHKTCVRAMISTPDARRLITTGDDGIVRVWDLSAPDPSVEPVLLRNDGAEVISMAVTPDSRQLVTGDMQGTTRLWDLTSLDKQSSPTSPIVLRGHEGPIRAVAVSPDNHWVITAGDDYVIRVWTLRVEELIDLALNRAECERNHWRSSRKRLASPLRGDTDSVFR